MIFQMTAHLLSSVMDARSTQNAVFQAEQLEGPVLGPFPSSMIEKASMRSRASMRVASKRKLAAGIGFTFRNQNTFSCASGAVNTLTCSRESIGADSTDALLSLGSPGCARWRIFMSSTCLIWAAFFAFGGAFAFGLGAELVGAEKCLARRA